MRRVMKTADQSGAVTMENGVSTPIIVRALAAGVRLDQGSPELECDDA